MNFHCRTLPFLVFLLVPVATQAQLPQEPAKKAQIQATAYPDTSDGLQKLIEDILSAVKAKDSARENELIHGLVMPEDTKWFTDEFGPGFGARLSAAYRKSAPGLEEKLRTVYEGNVERGWMKPKVTRYADAATVDSPIDTFLNCMEEVVPLYETAGNGNSIVRYFSGDPNQRGRVIAGDLLGYFVFAKGGFRFIPEEILMMLPSARPVRLKLDLNVMRSKLLNGSQTKFPEEAFRRRIFGEVVIHLIFDVGGNIKELKVMEGDPILSKWAIDEVRQWRFAPTLLDGDPVEVELEVTKSFTRQ